MMQSTDLQFLGRAGVNYLLNPGAETGRQGWSLFTTTFSSSGPTTITPGAANCTLTSSTTAPLRGTRSLAFAVTSAIGSIGQGFISDVFTVDNADLAKVLTAAFDYNFSAGGASVDVSGTSTQTLEIWVYNVGLAAWTQPAGFRGINQNSLPGYVAATFQTDSSNASNKNQYRVAVIIKNAPSGTFTMQVDQAVVGPQTVQYGAPVTDWVDYTPTGTWNTNVTYNGKWRRVGDSMEIRARVLCSGAPNAVGLGINLPSGFSMDTAKLTSTTAGGTPLGYGQAVDISVAAYPVFLTYFGSATQIGVYNGSAGGTYVVNGNVTNTAPFTFGATDFVEIVSVVPILGWSSTVQMSNDTDTRVVALRASRTTNQAAGTGNQDVVFDSVTSVALKEGDTHGAYNTSTGVYTVPVSGYYQITAHVTLTSSVLDQGLLIQTGSGTLLATLFTASGTFSTRNTQGSAVLKFNAGDTFKIVAGRAVSSTVQGSTTDALTTLDVQRLSGPSAIAATETVAGRWVNEAGTTIGTSSAYPTAVVPFASSDVNTFDTHGMASGSGTTWKVTAPVSGKYLLTANAVLDSTASAPTIQFYKNGTTVVGSFRQYATAGNTNFCAGSTTVSLNAGDFVQVLIFAFASGPLIAGDGLNVFTMTRVGN